MKPYLTKLINLEVLKKVLYADKTSTRIFTVLYFCFGKILIYLITNIAVRSFSVYLFID